MKNLIKKILREDFKNAEVMSSERNICDIVSANSWDEIEELLDEMVYDDQFKSQIEKLKKKMKQEKDRLGNDLDITNTYLRKIQNMVCK